MKLNCFSLLSRQSLEHLDDADEIDAGKTRRYFERLGRDA